jgi:RNA 3'-terminal phosphate cyclase
MSEEHLVVDEHHADQLIVYMALAEGTSLMRTTKELSLHSKTMV